jgi:hypothetical protein
VGKTTVEIMHLNIGIGSSIDWQLLIASLAF